MTLIPDQVLGWLGNMGNTQLGKEVEEKAHQMFVNMGRTMGGGVHSSVPKPKRGKDGGGSGCGSSKRFKWHQDRGVVCAFLRWRMPSHDVDNQGH